MRKTITLAMIIGGVALIFGSYFFLAAPWGFPPSGPVYSNPRLPIGPVAVSTGEDQYSLVDRIVSLIPPPPILFILGVMLVFLSAVVYELLPEKRS
jgi:drug/metabolite transporter (DMT)-like permease